MRFKTVQASSWPIILYTSPFSRPTKMRSLTGTAIFQITKYPNYKFLSKSGWYKYNDRGPSLGQIFLRGAGLVNRCQIWQSWHNWAEQAPPSAPNGHFVEFGQLSAVTARWKMLSFPTKIVDIFHACYSNLFDKYVPVLSSVIIFHSRTDSTEQRPKTLFQTLLLSDKRKVISGVRAQLPNYPAKP